MASLTKKDPNWNFVQKKERIFGNCCTVLRKMVKW